jgi:hypothetical protein
MTLAIPDPRIWYTPPALPEDILTSFFGAPSLAGMPIPKKAQIPTPSISVKNGILFFIFFQPPFLRIHF